MCVLSSRAQRGGLCLPCYYYMYKITVTIMHAVIIQIIANNLRQQLLQHFLGILVCSHHPSYNSPLHCDNSKLFYFYRLLGILLLMKSSMELFLLLFLGLYLAYDCVLSSLLVDEFCGGKAGC